MKHAGSREDLLGRSMSGKAEVPPPLIPAKTGQSRVSLAVSFACLLFLVAVVADPVVRDLALSLDPTVVTVLRRVTEFGNSAWSLGIGLVLLGCATLARRRGSDIPPDAIQSLRSGLMLLVGSVALSGALANLLKNVIGRARPSAFPEAGVLDFAMMTFRASWASFPSGHSTTAAAFAIVLAICWPRLSWAWLCIGLIAALSRAFLAVHWLSDCIAGLALGAIITLGLRTFMAGRGHIFRLEPLVVLRVIGLAAASIAGTVAVLGGRVLKAVMGARRTSSVKAPDK